MVSKTAISQPVLGKHIIYICQHEACGNREKEFAMVDRNYKYCSKCGSISIKSDLCDSYKHVSVDVTEDAADEEEYYE